MFAFEQARASIPTGLIFYKAERGLLEGVFGDAAARQNYSNRPEESVQNHPPRLVSIKKYAPWLSSFQAGRVHPAQPKFLPPTVHRLVVRRHECTPGAAARCEPSGVGD